MNIFHEGTWKQTLPQVKEDNTIDGTHAGKDYTSSC